MENCRKFRDFMDNVPFKKHNEIFHAIVEKCKVTQCTVYNWKKGKCGIRAVYLPLIEEAVGQKIF